MCIRDSLLTDLYQQRSIHCYLQARIRLRDRGASVEAPETRKFHQQLLKVEQIQEQHPKDSEQSLHDPTNSSIERL